MTPAPLLHVTAICRECGYRVTLSAGVEAWACPNCEILQLAVPPISVKNIALRA